MALTKEQLDFILNIKTKFDAGEFTKTVSTITTQLNKLSKSTNIPVNTLFDYMKKDKSFEVFGNKSQEVMTGVENSIKNSAKGWQTVDRAAQAHKKTLEALKSQMNNLFVGTGGQFAKGGGKVPAGNPAWMTAFKASDTTQQVDMLSRKMIELQKSTGATLPQIVTQFKKAGVEANVLNASLKKMPGHVKAFDRSIQGALDRFKFFDTFLGTLSAMFTFQLLNAVTTFFTAAIENAKKLHSELIQLNFAEAVLSKRGMDITRKELDDFVSYIQDKYKYLTKIEAVSIVSEVATATAEFNVSKKQLRELADAIAFIQLKQKMMGEESADAGSIINAAMDARSNYFNRLGVNITETLVKEKAYAMGLAETGSELDKNARFQAILALLTEQTSNKAEDLTDAIKGTREELELIAAQDWETATTKTGNFFENVKAGFLATYVQMKGFLSGVSNFFKPAVDIISGFQFPEWLSKLGDILSNLLLGPLKLIGPGLLGPFGAIYTMLQKFSKLGKTYEKGSTDTPTGDVAPDLFNEDAAADKAQQDVDKAFDDLKNDIEKANRDLENEKFDAKIDLDLKLEDIDIKYNQKVEDIIRGHARKVSDINRDYSQEVSDIKRDARLKESEAKAKFDLDEIKAEKDKNEQLLRLKEDYLMNLEDALHERDARQILKLMNQYELDKSRILRDTENESKSRKAQFEFDKKQRQAETEQRLADARTEHARKLEDANLARRRELEEAALARKRDIEESRKDYARKLQELHRNHQRELQEMGNALKAQYNLTAAQAKALQQMLSGNLSAYAQYAQSMINTTNKAISQMSGGKVTEWGKSGGSATPTNIAKGEAASLGSWWSRNFSGWWGDGGSFIANKPTLIGVGDGGSERVDILPMGRGKSSSMGFSGDGAGSGRVAIEVLLSPDLQARIVEDAMNGTADILMRTVRTK